MDADVDNPDVHMDITDPEFRASGVFGGMRASHIPKYDAMNSHRRIRSQELPGASIRGPKFNDSDEYYDGVRGGFGRSPTMKDPAYSAWGPPGSWGDFMLNTRSSYNPKNQLTNKENNAEVSYFEYLFGYTNMYGKKDGLLWRVFYLVYGGNP